MAQYTNTLAGLLQMNSKDLAPIEVSELLNRAPVLAALYAVKASNGTVHKYLRQTAEPGAGFRDINAGLVNAASQEELVTDTLKLLDATVRRDKALSMGYIGGREAYMAKELKRSLQYAFFKAEKSILTGTKTAQGGDAASFNGLADVLDQLTDTMVVNAAGAGGRSVYLVRSADDGVSVVAGMEGNIEVGEIYETTLFDGSSYPYSALALDVLGWLGLQVAYTRAAARIVNLDGTTNHKLTDAFLAAAIELFPVGLGPTHIIMGRKSHRELRDGRTATNPTGAPAPFPAEAYGIPIVVTDALSEAEPAMTTTTTT